MEFRHEIINFDTNSPMKVFVQRIGKVNLHWHQSLEMLIVIDGQVNITINKDHYELHPEDVILINSNDQHSLESEDCVMIAVQLKLSDMAKLPENLKTARLKCSTMECGMEKYERIKNVVATMLKVNLEGGKMIKLLNNSLIYEFVYELFSKFEMTEAPKTDDEYSRINQILKIINKEYMYDLSLEKIASDVYITVPYLSKIFKKTIGVTVGEYLRDIRLLHAKQELLGTSKSILQISIDNGFPNQKALASAFKEKDGLTPAAWKKLNTQDVSRSGFRFENTYYASDAGAVKEKITEFINKHTSELVRPVELIKNEQEYRKIEINNYEYIGKFTKNFKKYIGVSSVKELLYTQIQDELRMAQKTIGFSYIKMHGIFDDSLLVYNEDENGNPYYNFSILDTIFDFLMSVHIRPVIQFSYMPRLLARNKEKTVFISRMIISSPVSMKKWNDLVYSTTKHFIDRYGYNEVKEWPFTVWNEPSNLPVFGFEDYEDFFSLYKNTYATVKSVSNELQFFGPNEFITYKHSYYLLQDFLDRTLRENCVPDFININYYDINPDTSIFVEKTNTFIPGLQKNPDTFSLFISDMKSILWEKGLGNLPLHFIEWNSTTSHRDLLSDTCFKSAYIVRNVLQSSGKTDGMGYWLLSDFHFETPLPDKLFHGGLGLFTAKGGAKPSYYAYSYLNQLKENIVAQDDGYIITTDGTEYSMVLYNYTHFSDAYATETGINTTYEKRYNVFPEQRNVKLTLEFNVENGKYKISESLINRKYGSIFDNFIRMGLIEPIDANENSWLNGKSSPDYRTSLVNVENRKISLSFSLEPFEIRLVKIKQYE